MDELLHLRMIYKTLTTHLGLSRHRDGIICKEDVTGFPGRRQKKMIRAATWQIRQSGWLCLESRDRPREGRTGRVLIAEGQTAGYRHSQRPLGCTSRERKDESAAELEGRKSLPSPVDCPKMNEGGCTGPENETRRKGLSAACCCWMRSSDCSGERLDACKFGRASFEVLVSSSCRPIEENSL